MPDKPPNNEGAHFDAFRVNSHLTGNSNAQWLLGAMAATQVRQRELGCTCVEGETCVEKKIPRPPSTPPFHQPEVLCVMKVSCCRF